MNCSDSAQHERDCEQLADSIIVHGQTQKGDENKENALISEFLHGMAVVIGCTVAARSPSRASRPIIIIINCHNRQVK